HTLAAPSGLWPEAAEDVIADTIPPVLAVSPFERQILGEVVGRTETKPVCHRFQLDGVRRAVRIWDVAARVQPLIANEDLHLRVVVGRLHTRRVGWSSLCVQR